MQRNKVIVCGAGLAGCEAAYQLSKRGVKVTLYDIKPNKTTPAHGSECFAELCCSNSFRAEGISNAIGVLKEEMRKLDSLIMKAADAARVPAGGALAVDRDAFSKYITDTIMADSNIEFISKEIEEIPKDDIVIIATGPLTTGPLFEDIKSTFGLSNLHFFDAAAPIVSIDSVDMSKVYKASRYDKGTADYYNCPMEKEEYEAFYSQLINAETAELSGFEKDFKVFEGCMPVEVMAKRGEQTLLFGPLKPVGLINPHTGKMPYAVVQLRQDNSAASLYNLVGFQTHLKFGEQKRVFGMIPGLKSAEFVRYGVMHRNTFINSPKLLNNIYEVRDRKGIFFAGQMTGVEGYLESASSGLVAGINAAKRYFNEGNIVFDSTTAIGALANYISSENIEDFQPMNVNFGLFAPLEQKFKGKANKKELLAARALSNIDELIKEDIL